MAPIFFPPSVVAPALTLSNWHSISTIVEAFEKDSVESSPLSRNILSFQKTNLLNLARPDRLHLGLARATELRRISQRHQWSLEDDRIAEYLFDEVSLHASSNTMFTASLREQGTDEQRACWMPKVDNWENTGTYGQFEWKEQGKGVRRSKSADQQTGRVKDRDWSHPASFSHKSPDR